MSTKIWRNIYKRIDRELIKQLDIIEERTRKKKSYIDIFFIDLKKDINSKD